MKKIICKSFLDFRFISNPTFSPDGSHIAFVVTQADLKENGYKGDLYLYDLAAKKTIRLTTAGDAKSYAWTSNNTLLFPAMRADDAKKQAEDGAELTCYYEISPFGGEAVEKFRIPARATSIEELSDGRYLVTIAQDNHKEIRKSSYEIIDELPFWGNGLGMTNAKRNRLAIFDITDNSLEFLADDWTHCGAYSLFDDKILYKAYPWKASVRGLNFGIYLYNYKTESTKTILEPDTMPTGAMELLGEREAIVAALPAGSAGTDLVNYNKFYKLNLSDCSITPYVDYDASIGQSSVGSDARYGAGRMKKALNGRFYFVSTVEDFSRLYCLGEDGKISSPLTSGSSCDGFDINEKHLVSAEMRGMKLSELYLDGEQITHFNDEILSGYSLSVPEPVTFTATDGYEIHGWVMKPADYDSAAPAASYPAILNIHGGPRTVFSDVFFHEMQLWANAGYFVFYCNPRGSDGRGTEFGDVAGKYGTIDYVNLMDFTDEVLKQYPQINTNRVGVTGGSYGGVMTNWIVGHTDRFAAAVSQRSIANWVSYEHTSDIGHTFTPMDMAAVTRTNVELLWEQSPLKYAPNCKTPILFIHSDQDYRCYMAEGMAMYSAVKRNGCPARMCLFHGENHELSRSGKPENRIDRMKEILAWMDTYLK